jgi:hypothetical protein
MRQRESTGISRHSLLAIATVSAGAALHSAEQVDKMHLAWTKSMQLQLALWATAYIGSAQTPTEQPKLERKT